MQEPRRTALGDVLPWVPNHTFALWWVKLHSITVGVTTCSGGLVVSIRKDQGREMRLSVNKYRREGSGESCPLQCEAKHCPFAILIEQGQCFRYCFMDC